MLRVMMLALLVVFQSAPALAEPDSPRARETMNLKGPVRQMTEANALWLTDTTYHFSPDGRLTASVEISFDVENKDAESRIYWFYDQSGRPVKHIYCGLAHTDPSHNYCDVSQYEYGRTKVDIWGLALTGQMFDPETVEKADPVADGRLIAFGDLNEHRRPAFLEAMPGAEVRAYELLDTFNGFRVEYAYNGQGRLVNQTRRKMVCDDDGRMSTLPTEVEDYAYDDQGRPAEMKKYFYQDFKGDQGWGRTPTDRFLYEYDRDGRLVKETFNTFNLRCDELDTGENRVEALLSHTLYEYARPDARGNWTERTEMDRMMCDGGGEGGHNKAYRETVTRRLTYYGQN